MIAATEPPIDLTVPLIAGAAVWFVCAVVGGLLARSRNSSIALGVLMPLFCGFLGLFFVTRLPSRDELPEHKRRESLLPLSDADIPRAIDPEIAKQLGLPPQRTSDGQLASPPTGPPVVPLGFQAGGFQPGASAPAAPTLPSFGLVSPVAPPPVPPSAPEAVVPPAPAPQPIGGFWAADPTGRFAQRWWDGSSWTARVLRHDGVEHVDA